MRKQDKYGKNGKGNKLGRQNEFDKAIHWIKSGNKTVFLHKQQYVKQVELLLNVKLKKLSQNKYLVLTNK